MEVERSQPAARPRGLSFQGERLAVGEFVARPGDPWFSDSGPARGYLVVFPWQPVIIEQAGAAPFVADPTRVVFYNRGQEYRRARLAPTGDHCVWIALSHRDALDAVLTHDPAAGDRPDRPFSRAEGPCDPQSYLCHRLLFQRASRAVPVDPLEIEEIAMLLLDRVIAEAYRARPAARTRRAAPATAAAHRALADGVKAVVAAQSSEPLSLAEVAGAVGASPFHTARVFRASTGHTIHGYREALRLGRAVLHLADGAEDLTALALDLGYASHSHFTLAFRRRFGLPPSRVRGVAAGPGLAELRRLARPPR